MLVIGGFTLYGVHGKIMMYHHGSENPTKSLLYDQTRKEELRRPIFSKIIFHHYNAVITPTATIRLVKI